MEARKQVVQKPLTLFCQAHQYELTVLRVSVSSPTQGTGPLPILWSLDIHGGLVPGPLTDTKIHGCSSSLYKMATCSLPPYLQIQRADHIREFCH